jgi:Coenzyme PQQ synthesis protein D (PqqD)
LGSTERSGRVTGSERSELALLSETRFIRSPRAVFRELADGTGVLLHLDSTSYHAVNRTGVLIWELLEDGNDAAGITAEIRAHFEDSPPSLAEDVARYVEGLRSRGLILVERASRSDET